MTVTRLKFFSPLVYTLSLIIITYCAHKVAPSGGPEDKTAPEIIKVFPSPDSVGISNLEYIEIEFSEAIRQTSILNNYWLIPELKDGLEVKWKGNEKIRFYLKDSLDNDQTYVLTLGTGIRDMRNNAMVNPYTLAFSTGTSLYSGEISGNVYSDKFEKEVFIYGYPLEANSELDSLLFRKALYYTQIDAEGAYSLKYLPFKSFRLIALKDNNLNKHYDLESDLVGVPFMDVKLDSSSPRIEGFNFHLIEEDTTAPRIKNIDTVSVKEITVQFTEPVKLQTDFKAAVWDTLSLQNYDVTGKSISTREEQSVQLFFNTLPENRVLGLQLTGVCDFYGNKGISPGLYTTFTSSAALDTLPPRLLTFSPANEEKSVRYNAQIKVSFNSPVDSVLFTNSFEMVNEKKDQISGKFNFQDLLNPVFVPSGLLEKNMDYAVQVKLDSLKDIFGRAFSDTTITSIFTTMDWADLGEIAGTVKSSDSSWTRAIIEALPVAGKELHLTRSKIGERYEIPFLPGGLYRLRTTVDVNLNGDRDFGRTLPWTFSEPFLVRPDTVKVRKRWTSEGVNFLFAY